MGQNDQLAGIRLQDGTEIACQLAVVAVGVKPNSRLAREAAALIGSTGGIVVDRHMKTSAPDIYAAGDCVESTHLITGAGVFAPYGDLANLQGRVAGENAVMGDTATHPGTIQTGICQIFDYAAGSTGLSERAARGCRLRRPGNRNQRWSGQARLHAGKAPRDSVGRAPHNRPDPRSAVCRSRRREQADRHLGDGHPVPFDNRRYGQRRSAVHTPFSLAIDHSITTAHLMQNKLQGHMQGISAAEVRRRTDAGDTLFVVDVRSQAEFDQMRLGVGEYLIPLDTLRGRLSELPPTKTMKSSATARSPCAVRSGTGSGGAWVAQGQGHGRRHRRLAVPA